MERPQKQMNNSEIRARIAEIAEKYRLSLVLLFGSQATGKTHKQSDYDVAYLGEHPLTLAEESGLIVDLMPVFQTATVDLVNIHNAPPLLAYDIARSAQTLYERTAGLFTSFYLYALRQYEETKPLFELRSVYLAKKIAELKAAH